MNAKSKVVLHTKKGVSHLAIRFTMNRQSSYSYLGYEIEKDCWVDQVEPAQVSKQHPKSGHINETIRQRYEDAEELIKDCNKKRLGYSHKKLKRMFEGESNDVLFSEYADAHIEQLKIEGKWNRISTVQSHYNEFKRFLMKNGNKEGEIEMDSITIKMIKVYRSYLKGKGNKHNTIYSKLSSIRRCLNDAIADKAIEGLNYPFGGKNKIKMKKKDGQKIGLTQDEIKRLENVRPKLELKKLGARTALNTWLFEFYLAGARISDILLLRWSNIMGDRLYYTMGKNGKNDSVKLAAKALVILEELKKFQDYPNDFIFPYMKTVNVNDKKALYNKIKTSNRSINDYMRKIKTRKDVQIDKPTDCHITRHSFGNIAKGNIPPEVLQKLYRHSILSTTIQYQRNWITEQVDAAVDTVVDF